MGEKHLVKRGNVALIDHYDGGKTVVPVIGLYINLNCIQIQQNLRQFFFNTNLCLNRRIKL